MSPTFFSSKGAISYLQERFGSADYNNWQAIRREFWSFVDYPEAGLSSLTFFGEALGVAGTNRQFTNMPKQGSFGQVHFLLKGIQTEIFIADWMFDAWNGDDDSTLYSDIINGFAQEGYMKLQIQERNYVQLPKPFLYAPQRGGQDRVFTAGLEALTLSEGAPNVVTDLRTAAPYASLNPNHKDGYVVDPNILIEAEQNFSVRIEFPSGAVPVIGTDVTDDTTNPLKVGVRLTGVELRPLQ